MRNIPISQSVSYLSLCSLDKIGKFDYFDRRGSWETWLTNEMRATLYILEVENTLFFVALAFRLLWTLSSMLVLYFGHLAQSFVDFKHLPSGERFPRAFLVFIGLQEIN